MYSFLKKIKKFVCPEIYADTKGAVFEATLGDALLGDAPNVPH